MARPKRIIYEGAIYHVIMRGNNRDYIFNNPKHKSFLLKRNKNLYMRYKNMYKNKKIVRIRVYTRVRDF